MRVRISQLLTELLIRVGNYAGNEARMQGSGPCKQPFSTLYRLVPVTNDFMVLPVHWTYRHRNFGW